MPSFSTPGRDRDADPDRRSGLGAAFGFSRPVARLALLVPALVLAPFVVLVAYAFPQQDDFCFGSVWQDQGFVGTLAFFYRGFVGRLFSNSVIMMPFVLHQRLGIDLLLAYRLVCAAVLIATLAVALWVGATLLERASRPMRLFLGLALAVALIAGNPAPNDLFYWVSQMGNYSIAAIVSLAVIVALHRAAERRVALRAPVVLALAATGFVIAMATEFSGAVLFVIVLGSLARRWLTPGAPRQVIAHALILAAITAGALVVALAPGNAVRLGMHGLGDGLAGRAVLALPMTLVWLGQFLFQRATSPALLAWVIAVALATWAHDRQPGAAPVVPKPALLVWLPLAMALVAIYAALWIGQLGLGGLLPPRARGHLHFVLVGGLTLTTGAATRAYGERWHARIAARWPQLSARHAAVLMLLLMAAAPHFLSAAYALGWQAGPLARSVEDRFARLGPGRTPGGPIADRELVLPPIEPRPYPVFTGDIQRDPKHWTNDCLARYAGVRAVRLP